MGDIVIKRDGDHFWKGEVPRCIWCGCTSLEALYKQPETKGVGPCPLKPDQELASRLLQEWAAKFRETHK